jgi:hypothetical protein
LSFKYFLFKTETVECRHIIFWPGSQARVYAHTARLEPNRRVSIDDVPLSAFCKISFMLDADIQGIQKVTVS